MTDRYNSEAARQPRDRTQDQHQRTAQDAEASDAQAAKQAQMSWQVGQHVDKTV